MRYTVLNRQYFEANGCGAIQHFRIAMRNRGWYPDIDDVRRCPRGEREALEERGPRNEDPLQSENQTVVQCNH